MSIDNDLVPDELLPAGVKGGNEDIVPDNLVPEHLKAPSVVAAPQKDDSTWGKIKELAMKVGAVPIGTVEAGMHAMSGIPALGAAGMGSLYNLATSAPGTAAKNAANSSAYWQDALTYQPKTQAGQTFSKVLDKGLGYLGNTEGEWARDKLLEAGANPYVAAGTQVAANVPSILLGGLKGKYLSPSDMANSFRAQKAAEIIDKNLARDRTDIETAGPQVSAANAQGVEARLNDVAGDNTQALADAIAQKPGDARTQILEDRNRTHADTKQRVGQQVTQALGATTNDAGLFADLLDRSRSAKAKANYEAVRQDDTPVMDPKIWEILDHPAVAQIYQDAVNGDRQARSLGVLNGQSSPPLAEIYAQRTKTPPPNPVSPGPSPIDLSQEWNSRPQPTLTDQETAPMQAPGQEWVRTGTAPNVRSMDFLIRAMDKRISSLYNQARADTSGGAAGAGAIADQLKGVRKQLIDRMKDISPEYKTASETYGSDMGIKEHFELGQSGKFFDSPGLAQKTMDSASDAEKNALRIGVVDNLLSKYRQSGRSANVARNVLGGEDTEKVLGTMFDNQRDFDIFKKTMQLEAKVYDNSSSIKGGSQTVRRALAGEDFINETGNKVGRVASILSQLHHGWFGAAAHGVLRLMDAGTLWDDALAKHVSNVLTNKDPLTAYRELVSMGEQSKASQPLLHMIEAGSAAGNAGRSTNPKMQQLMDKYGLGEPVSQ